MMRTVHGKSAESKRKPLKAKGDIAAVHVGGCKIVIEPFLKPHYNTIVSIESHTMNLNLFVKSEHNDSLFEEE